MGVRLAAALVAACAASGAQAQGNPSTDQIINSLRPTGGMMGGTRGIRPAAPNPAQPPPASSDTRPAAAGMPRYARPDQPSARLPSQPPAATPPAPSVNLSVLFTTNSAELTPAAMTTLTALGQALSSNTLGSYRFRIEGHTDTVGTADTNKSLSERRAQAVVTFLASRFRIDPSRLDAVGMGEEGLLVPTPANTAEPRNRRVQVINLGS